MLLLGPPGYACPIYSRTGKVTEGGEATALHMFCKIDVAKREKFATVTEWAASQPLEVYSFGMVMFELLTGLAPATADASRREVRGKDFTKEKSSEDVTVVFLCMCEPHTPKNIHEIS